MPSSGRVVFGQMDEVVFGKPAAEAVLAQAERLGAARVLLLVSNSLNHNTDAIERVRRALGNRCVATFDRMPPHTPRSAVILATEMARASRTDLIVTIGGGSITDAAKAVQMCLANDIRSAEAIDGLRPVKRADGSIAPAALRAPTPRLVARQDCACGRHYGDVGRPLGTIGRDRRRTPVALAMALPTAGARATSGVSPAPAARSR